MAEQTSKVPATTEPKEQTRPKMDVSTVDSLEKSVQMADRYFSLLDRIKKRAISLTNRNDWIDQAGNPYLEISGATKIAMGFGLNVTSQEYDKEQIKDDRGEYVIYTVRGIMEWNGRTIQQIGTASSRDDFFAKGKNEAGEKILLPLAEIDLTDIKKKAFTNFENRGIKDLLGLSFTWEEVEHISEGKIKKEMCQKFSYTAGGKGGKQESAQAGDKRSELRKIILDMNYGDETKAKEALIAMTAWKNNEDKEIPGKSNVMDLSEKQINFLLPKMKESYAAFQKQTEKETAGAK